MNQKAAPSTPQAKQRGSARRGRAAMVLSLPLTSDEQVGGGWGGAGGYWGGANHGSYGFTTLENPNTTVADQLYQCKSTTFSRAPCTDILGGSDLRNFARSYHTGGLQMALSDGSGRFVSDNISLVIWRAVGSRNGNEVTGEW